MNLSMKSKSTFRASLLGLALAIGATSGAGPVFARAMSGQPTGSPQSEQNFAGTWHWMFGGNSFATTTLIPSGSGFEGNVTESHIALNDDGTLKKADPTDDKSPKQISKAEMLGNVLHVTVAGGFAFTMTLKDETHAELRPVGAPPNMKPIALVKAY